MHDAKQTPGSALHEFAAALAHDLRTPLVAVAGEIDLALRRDRTAAEYREALRRIHAGISELVEITGDLALLSEPIDAAATRPISAPLETVLARIAARYTSRDDIRLDVAHASAAHVRGDVDRLARAITLVVEHALKNRKAGSQVIVRAVATEDGVRLVVDAQPSGFWPRAWASLTGSAAVPLRLRTAGRILEAYDGALLPATASSGEVVHIELHGRV